MSTVRGALEVAAEGDARRVPIPELRLEFSEEVPEPSREFLRSPKLPKAEERALLATDVVLEDGGEFEKARFGGLLEKSSIDVVKGRALPMVPKTDPEKRRENATPRRTLPPGGHEVLLREQRLPADETLVGLRDQVSALDGGRGAGRGRLAAPERGEGEA